MAAATAAVEHAASGFSTFLLKPNDLKGDALFKHMMQIRLHHAPPNHVS
jgi:hypothetical protein